MEKVTIAMPTRNGGEWLERAIKSIVSQSWKNLEVWICDNASQPSTSELCRKWAGLDDRVRYLRHPHVLPAPDNFLSGLEKADSAYFMWLADDDYLEPNYIECCVRLMEADHSVVLAYGRAQLEFDDGRVLPVEPVDIDQPSAADRVVRYYETVEYNGAFYGVHRTEILRTIPWPPHTVAGDWLMLASIAWRGKIRCARDTVFHQAARSTDSFEAMAARLGLHALQGTGARLSSALSACNEIVWTQSGYDTATAEERLELGRRVFRVFMKRYGGDIKWVPDFIAEVVGESETTVVSRLIQNRGAMGTATPRGPFVGLPADWESGDNGSEADQWKWLLYILGQWAMCEALHQNQQHARRYHLAEEVVEPFAGQIHNRDATAVFKELIRENRRLQKEVSRLSRIRDRLYRDFSLPVDAPRLLRRVVSLARTFRRLLGNT